MIEYYSTNRQVPSVTLDEALIMGQAKDRGLFLPRPIPSLDSAIFERGRDMSYPELATAVLAPYCEGVFERSDLADLCEDAYDFDVPIERVAGNRHLIRLDQGPTASFKDFAARFMGRALNRLVKQRGHRLLILTATSGDTGSAIAHAFLGLEAIEVVVLFPRTEVSDRQRKQMTTLGGNVATVAIEGKFDDCQALVKQAFSDPDLDDLHLSSANSINIGRLLPQSAYYVYAATRLADVAAGEPVVFSVPSGNFGDLMAGILAFKGGLPVARFVVATNPNDEVPRFFESGRYEKLVPSRVGISNAMNVGHPSNLARLVDLYGGWLDETGKLREPPDLDAIRRELYAISISDELTRETIAEVYRAHQVMLEPHGAVGWAGLETYLATHPEHAEVPSICLETAHPAKFPEELRVLTQVDPALPPSLEGLEELPEQYSEMEVDYAAFKAFLEKEYR